MAKKILISTDIGSDCDDALSVLATINSGLPIGGIYTVNGDVKARAYIAKHLTRLARLDVPVYIGEANPIWSPCQPYSHYEDFHVDSGCIDKEASENSREIIYLDPERMGIGKSAIGGLEDALSKEEHVVFSLGPLTNIAKLLLSNPQATRNISRIYLMGCRFSNGGQLGHNVRYDVDAARTVFSSDIPITVVPGDLCNEWRMPVSYLDDIKSPAGLYAKKMAESQIGIATSNAIHRGQLGNLDLDLRRRILDNKDVMVRAKSALVLLSAHTANMVFLREVENVNLSSVRKLEGLPREVALKEYQDAKNILERFNGKRFSHEDAAFSPTEFFTEYRRVINRLRDKKVLTFQFGDISADLLESLVPTDISVSDLYVPFCYQFPESTKIEKGNVIIEDSGATKRIEGDRCDIVTKVDIKRFDEYIQENLH
ncbi:MAG: nucleoside hydrolase [Nanoarchaeota archaeon]